MPLGQVIELYLMDGTPSGRWQASLSNWNGKLFRFSRRDLAASADFSELDAPGVYFLFGRDAETERPFVYVGEGDYVRKRILQPHAFEKIGKADECFWTEAVILVTPDETLNKARIRYLEHRFHQLVTQSSRYLVKNGNTPSMPPLSRKDQDLLEQMILNTKIIMPALGHKVFESMPSSTTSFPDSQTDTDLLYFSRSQGKGGSATGKSSEDGFWVLKGSYIFPDLAPYLPQGVRKLREKYASAIDAEGLLQEDILFSSPSYAASFVCGKNANGPTEWKDRSGRSLKDLNEGTAHQHTEPTSQSAVQDPQPEPEKEPEKFLHSKEGALFYFHRKKGRGGNATGRPTESGFLVLKGSYICPDLAPYLPQGVRNLREKYASAIDAEGLLQEDILFSSPSYAASFVCGKPINGLTEWKDRNGRSLKDLKGETSQHTSGPASQPAVQDPQPKAGREPEEQTGELLHLKSTSLTAQGRQTQKGFLVLAGSRFSATESKGCPEWVLRLRRQMVESGAVADLTFTADTLFNSSSAAASCICGFSRSGPASWSAQNGTVPEKQAPAVPQLPEVPAPPAPDPPAEDTSPVPDKLHLVSPQIRASGRMLADGFLVFEGSQVREEETSSCPASARKQRQARREDGTVRNGTLTRDLLFPSSSGAASFLLGRNANGKDEWCNAHRVRLKVLLERTAVDDVTVPAKETRETIVEPVPEPDSTPDSVPTSKLLYLASRKASGTGCLTEGGFLVLQGSTLSPEETASCPAKMQLTRRTLQSDGTVQDGVFLRDVLFSSPSAAAGCLLGSSSNGLQVWKNRTGIPLKDLLAQEEPDQP